MKNPVISIAPLQLTAGMLAPSVTAVQWAQTNLDIRFRGSPTAEEWGDGHYLMLGAWAVLVSNIDLVSWATQQARANHPTFDIVTAAWIESCIIRLLTAPKQVVLTLDFRECDYSFQGGPGEGSRLGVVVDEVLSWIGVDTDWGSSTGYKPGFYNAYVDVCMGAGRVKLYTDLWCEGWAVDVNCALVDLSATLFHELLHACWLNVIGEEHVESDTASNHTALLENYYRYAVMRRYPGAASSPCCARSASSEVYGSTDYQWPYVASDCVPTDPGQTSVVDWVGLLDRLNTGWLGGFPYSP